MRKILPRALAASATLMAVLAPTAFGGWGRVETIYVEPTGTTMILPTSYSEIVPTSYSYPVTTSYVTTSATLLPASYAFTATSYMPMATAYYVPTYYRTGLFGRLRPRAAIYEPTAYYLPTTVTSYEAPVVATAYRGPCQESSIAFNAPSPVPGAAAKGITSKPGNGGEPGYNDPTDKKAAEETAKPKEKNKGIVDPGAGEASPPDKPEMPADPAPEKQPLPDANPKAADRQAFRPAPTEMRAKLGASAQNVLRGEVVSGATGKSLPAVKVVFSNLSGRYKDRQKETDAKGSFDVYLPDGDWSITVVDPLAAGAAPKVIGNITATSGKYLDEDDRPIYSLKVWN